MPSRDSGPMGGTISWTLAEQVAPECSPRWDADEMGDWQGEREGPYLHITWERPECLIAVVYDPKQDVYAAARWDGPTLGWSRDACVGSVHAVMSTPALIDDGKGLGTSSLSSIWETEDALSRGFSLSDDGTVGRTDGQ